MAAVSLPLLKQAQAYLDQEEFDSFVKSCGEILEAQPDCVQAARGKVFGYVQLGKWHEALGAVQSAEKLDLDLKVEKAYCQYRLNQFDPCLATIKEARKQGASAEAEEALAKVEAQVLYRMDKYDPVLAAYESMEADGALTNLLAAYTSGGQAPKAIALAAKHEQEVEESVENMFNVACAQLEVGRLDLALKTLESARALAVNELEDEDEDQCPEIAAIDVQKATCLQLAGKLDEANDIYNRVVRVDRDVDVTVLAVGCNNVVALRPDGKSLFDSLKRINVASKESLEHKLVREQAVKIAFNKCLVFLQGRKFDECRAQLAAMKQKYPGESRWALVAAAAALAEKKGGQSEKILKDAALEFPDAPDVVLALAELQRQRDPEQALQTMQKLPEAMMYAPSTLAQASALYGKGKVEEAETLLRAAMKYQQKATAGLEDQTVLAQCLRVTMAFAAKHKRWALSAEAHKLYLETIDGSDAAVLCELVEALSHSDPPLAERYAQRLPAPDTAHLDPEELEVAPAPKIKGNKKEKEEKGDADAPEQKAARKRKRKVRYPKNFDPENPGPPPDPERWLPKYERAEYKKKMKKRDKNLARGPQGAMVAGQADAFRKTGPSTAQVDVSAESAGRQKKNQNRKSKQK